MHNSNIIVSWPTFITKRLTKGELQALVPENLPDGVYTVTIVGNDISFVRNDGLKQALNDIDRHDVLANKLREDSADEDTGRTS